jgi:hypothetical protein
MVNNMTVQGRQRERERPVPVNVKPYEFHLKKTRSETQNQCSLVPLRGAVWDDYPPTHPAVLV